MQSYLAILLLCSMKQKLFLALGFLSVVTLGHTLNIIIFPCIINKDSII